MLIRNIVSHEYYSFENKEEIQRILSIDSFGTVEIQEKWIEYSLDRNYCVRLSDLSHQIASNLVMLNFTQFFDLIKQILIKAVNLMAQQVEHEYLDINRVWLQLDEESENPSIICQKLIYTIHFTGYQCPFYEKQIQQQSKQSLKFSVKQIILELIQQYQTQLQLQATDLDYKQNCKQQLIDPLILLFKNEDSLIDIITNLSILKSEQNNLFENNPFEINQVEKRKKWISKLNEDISSIMNLKSEYPLLVLEYLFDFYIPTFAEVINDKCDYKKMKLDFFQQIPKILNEQQEIKNQYQSVLSMILKSFIKYNLEQYQQIFRIELSENEILQMQNEIILSFEQHPQIKYFANTYWLQKNNDSLINLIKQQVSKQVKEVVQERFHLYIQIFILKLIHQLI